MGKEIADELSAEELAAASGSMEEGVDDKHRADRGDFLVEGDDAGEVAEGGGAATGSGTGAAIGKGDGEGNDGSEQVKGKETGGTEDNLETLQALADGDGGAEGEVTGEQPIHSGMPFARANQISREKNAANDLVEAILAGTIDKRWVADMGGQQAVVKGIAAGKILLPQPAEEGGIHGGQEFTVHPEIAKLESKLDELNRALADATVNVDSEEMLVVQKQINAVNRDIIRAENNIFQQAEAEEARKAAERQDAGNVKTVMEELWDKYPELHTDTNEYLAFIARRDACLRQGMPMSKALQTAASQTFIQTGDNQGGKDTQQQVTEQRLTAAREKAAKAKVSQPPAGHTGVGARAASGKRSIEKLSDAEFDKLSKEEKAIQRGDIL